MAVTIKAKAFKKALMTLRKALGEDRDEYMRDSIIQRFEYSVELFWKVLKEYLYEKENIEALSPNNVMRECRNAGLFSEEEAVLAMDMIKDRNLSSHAYNEELADEIVERVGLYADFMEKIRARIK